MTADNRIMRNRAGATAAILAALFLAGCQTPDTQGALESAGADEKFTEADLRAYCPRITLREGTANFRTYTKGGEDNPDEVIYQASITDVTRTCKYRNGQLYMTVAAAGRIVNGPQARAGSVTLPVRVAITEGENVPYSNLGRLDVAVSGGNEGTQFIYKDEQVVLAEPATRNLQAYVGFDEGPYDTP